MTQTVESFASLGTPAAQDFMGEPGGTIHVGASLREVIDRFLTGPSRHLIVVVGGGRWLGVLGPRHVAQAHRFGPRRDPEASIEDLGCVPSIALRPEDDPHTCARMLVERDLDAIPVLDPDRRVLGVVTAHDIARAAADAPVNVHPLWQE